MIVAMHDIWDDARTFHGRYIAGLAKKALARKGDKELKSPFLKQLLDQHGRRLATGSPAELREVIELVRAEFKGNGRLAAKNLFLAEAKSVFNYAAFTDKGHAEWDAYALCKMSRYRTCPYCHQSFAFTVVKAPGGKSFRPTLDHFYDKKSHPYLALSLYNLVPSCHICNSSLKGSENFLRKQHLHPFEDEELIGFNFDLDNYLLLRDAPAAQFQMQVEIRPAAAKKMEAARRSVETFLLNERYDFHFEYLARFAKLVGAMSTKEMQRRLKEVDIDADQSEILAFDRAQYREELLGCIKRDIYDAIAG